MIIILCIVGFIAAFVDSIAGGGGLLSLPAFMLSGLPAHLTLGTNKLSASMGSLTSSYQFIRSKKVNFAFLKFLIPCTLLGAAIGVHISLAIPEAILNLLIVLMMFLIALYTLFSKNIGEENHFTTATPKLIALGMLFAFVLGFYDGFFGPGVGSFLVFGMIKLFGFDFITATGNAKLLNFTSNVCALILFALNGQINFTLGLPVGCAMIIGAFCGSRLALKQGSKLIKPIFVSISLLLCGKLLLGVLL